MARDGRGEDPSASETASPGEAAYGARPGPRAPGPRGPTRRSPAATATCSKAQAYRTGSTVVSRHPLRVRLGALSLRPSPDCRTSGRHTRERGLLRITFLAVATGLALAATAGAG